MPSPSLFRNHPETVLGNPRIDNLAKSVQRASLVRRPQHGQGMTGWQGYKSGLARRNKDRRSEAALAGTDGVSQRGVRGSHREVS